MGNRKERRRLAAMSSSGRRVKLDLFAEPSGGDLGGSAEHEGVGGEVHSKSESGLPNSPSSSGWRRTFTVKSGRPPCHSEVVIHSPSPLFSVCAFWQRRIVPEISAGDFTIGQQPENPLLLLGQYSDEELDDGSNKTHSGATLENSSPQNNDEVKSVLNESGQNLDNKGGDEPASQNINPKELDTNSYTLDRDQSMGDIDKREIGDPIPGDLCTEVDLTENVTLPETSNVQVIGDVSSGWKIVMHEESKSYYYWNTETGETSWEVPDVLAQAATSSCDPKLPSVETTENLPVGMQESNGYSNSDVIEGSSNIVPQVIYGDGSQMNDWNLGSYTGSEIDPSHLIKYTEALLERLQSLQRSKDQLQGVDWFTKYILEIEIRLFDLKSLFSYGSSLLPFWMHSEIHIKRLESAINDEMSKIFKPEESNEVEASHALFSQGDIKFRETTGSENEVERVEHKQHISSLNDCQGSLRADAVNEDQEVKDSIVKNEHVSAFGSPSRHMEVGASEQVHGIVVPDELTTKTKNEVYVEEDVDMDVDMEVEDSISGENASISYGLHAKEFTETEQPIQPNPTFIYTSLVSEDTFAVPPLPDEEWIPPPPPDNEQVPPPPPDEPPPESPHPPLSSYSETGQPAYAEQYSFSYPISSYEYYGHTVTEAPVGNYYGHAEGCQVAIPHLPVYYGAVPSTYSENAQVVAHPVVPVTYYGLQDGTVPTPPVGSRVNSSQLHSEAAPLSSDNLTSDHPGSINSSEGAGSSGSNLQVPSTSATVQAPATIVEKYTIAVPITNSGPTAAPIPATSVVAKVQSNVLRTKKRSIPASSSLRSNKKVSSLVDKWKAAKEELLEDEEEPENTYESLERKRQREIEEWYSQQIMSGEAKDNANFQPLGGNWREKVKRRKAQLAHEAVETEPEAPNNGNQQPDLTGLSRDLPSGWQVCWDESSKQAYYGNAVTSETTWTRPTK